jgi:GDP-6-deoxy-D-talose 4-dehydrogenase
MARALITGIEGFTGSYLAAELRLAGYDIFGLAFGAAGDSTQGGAGDGAEEIISCDLNDMVSVESAVGEVQPDIIVHLAGISFVAHGDVDAIYRTNIVGTRNLLAAASRLNVAPSAVLLASSANIYGNANVETIDENVPAAPANDYAVSKLAMEYVARLWADKLRITIVRPFNYTGVGQSINFLLPKLVDHFKRRAPMIELGNLEVVREFSDVRNVAEYYRRLIQRNSNFASGDAFNICSGVGHSLLEAIEMMREISGHSPEIRVNPEFVRANEVKKLVGSRAKLESAIGPVESIPLRDTLRWMYEAP